jgi:hypothetical protein
MSPDSRRYAPAVEGELSQKLRERVAERFAHLDPEFDEASSCVVRIRGPAGGVGEVEVENHAGGLIVHVGNFTHGHFDGNFTDGHFDEDDAVETCCNFLDDLISDKVVVWRWETDGSGGWFYLTSMQEGWWRRRSRRRVHAPVPDGSEMYTWSARWWP